MTPSRRDEAAGASDAETAQVALVERAQRGDRDAFRALVEANQRSLYYTVMRWRDHPQDAADIVQQTFIKVYESLDQLREPAAFRGWLYRIARNLTRNHVTRSREQHQEPIDEHHHLEASADVERDAMARQRLRLVRGALDELSPKQRQVLMLRLESGLDYREVAEATDSTPGAVRVHFHNAVKRLKEALKRHEQAQETTS